MRMVSFQTFTAAFRLSRKKTPETYFFGQTIRILRNIRLNVWQKALIISLDGKKWKMQYTTTLLVKADQYILVMANQHTQI